MVERRRSWRWWSAGVVMTLALVGVIGFSFYEPGWRYEVRGVDVSHHQGEIDWDAPVADRTTFAYIKATEGMDRTDTRFMGNWEESAEAGVIRGAYHFFTLCSPGEEQARHMIANVPIEGSALPPAVDLEFGGNCSARPSVEDFRVELDSFLALIGDHYGMKPVIYTNADFYETYLSDDPPDVIWWVMSPFIEPLSGPEWTFWQHFTGKRSGVEGRVDRNAFRGNLDELVELTGQGES